MKTPDEIKKDAETCMSHPHTYSCNSCRLYSECHGIAEHIIKELYDLVVSYESRLAQVERERDAAADDARLGTMCDTCKHNNSKDYSNCAISAMRLSTTGNGVAFAPKTRRRNNHEIYH